MSRGIDRGTPALPGGGVHEARVRVRYPEVDPQGVVHHSVYLHYLELGRTEMLRELGLPYSELEKGGARLVVTEAVLRYLAAARYDDVLVVRTRVERVTRVRLFLAYEVARDGDGVVACEGRTTLAAVTPEGRPTALPRELRSAFDGG